MGVERVDYSSEDEYEQARQYEEEYYREQFEREQEPNVVPCYKCNCQMYEENVNPEKNICNKCKLEEEI